MVSFRGVFTPEARLRRLARLAEIELMLSEVTRGFFAAVLEFVVETGLLLIEI